MKKSKSLPPPSKTFREIVARDFRDALIFPPSRQFEIGDKVTFGNHNDVTVIDKTEDGKFYQVETIVTERDKGTFPRLDVHPWYNLFPFVNTFNDFDLMSTLDIRYSVTSRDIGGLLSLVENAGVDFAPDYQRPLVWTQEQKENLISTIFDKGNIGSVAFNRRDYAFDGPLYEVVDGKQRLSTLVQFRQDQFKFRGYYFSQLSRRDQHSFGNHVVQMYSLEKASKKEILQMFLLINRRGTPVDEEHIGAVEKMLVELRYI